MTDVLIDRGNRDVVHTVTANHGARFSDYGMDRLVELAEALQCPVIDSGGRANFPTRHPLNHSGRSGAVLAQADVILGLELNDFFGTTHVLSDRIERRTRSILKPGARSRITSGAPQSLALNAKAGG